MICTKVPITEFKKVASLLTTAVGGAVGFAIGGPLGGIVGASTVISGIIYSPELDVYICVCHKCGYILTKPTIN